MTAGEAFYAERETGFAALESTRGPWSQQHQHGGPPAALLARAVERYLAPASEFQVVRMTCEILRPVPIDTLSITTQAVHEGRSLQVIEAALFGPADKPLMRARAVAVRRAGQPTPETQAECAAPASPADSKDFEFDFFTSDQGYHTAMELRRADAPAGQAAMWMRMRIPLLAGETPSPLQRVMIAADSGNGISCQLDPKRYTFINPDLTVYLHRHPQGPWICVRAQTTSQRQGVGLSDAVLFDAQGTIGRSNQSLIIKAREQN